MNLKREVTPVQTQGGERGVMHGRRCGMADGKAVNRAAARRGIDGGLAGLKHAKGIRGTVATSKLKVLR
jgi:hypothetical protein